MADHGDRTRRPVRAPVRSATRRRWLVAGGIGGLWLLLLAGSGSVFLATVLFLVGISGHFPVRQARYGLIGIGGLLLIFSVIQLAELPGPPK